MNPLMVKVIIVSIIAVSGGVAGFSAYNTLIEFTANFTGSGLTNLTQAMKIP